MDIPYVVKLTNHYQLAAEKPLFHFCHPAPSVMIRPRAGGVAYGEQPFQQQSSLGQGVTAMEGDAPSHHRQPHSNERFKTLRWTAPFDCTVHGFAGFFESTLYQSPANQPTQGAAPSPISISIAPRSMETYSPGMFSWFPLFVPLCEPPRLARGERLETSFWRRCGPGRVWYEWAVVGPRPSVVQNSMGTSCHVGL